MAITQTVEFYNGTTWVDFSADVMADPPVSISRGFNGSAPTDRIAITGSCTFTLDNSAGNSGGLLGYYSPDHANIRTGFGIGTRVRVKYTDGTTTRYKFHGRIDSIKPTFGQYKERRVEVGASDYIEQLAARKLDLLPVQLSKRTDQLITTIIASLTIAPLATSYATGLVAYPYALDMERDEKTTAYAAIAKAVQSGLGYFYIRGDATGGETLVFETRQSRITATSQATLSNTMVGLRLSREAQMIYNSIACTVTPRRADASAVVLATLQGEISISAGASETLELRYVDPNNQAVRVSGTSMVTPVSGTDYKFSATSASGNNDIGASLGVVMTFGGNSAQAVLTNNHTATGYLNLFQLRGLGLYLYDDVVKRASDATSITALGEKELVFSLPYESNRNTAADLATTLLDYYGEAFTEVSAVEFLTNTTGRENSALVCDVGDLVTVEETLSGVSLEFFVSSVKYKLVTPTVLLVEWGLEPNRIATDVFILDSATNGILNVNKLGA